MSALERVRERLPQAARDIRVNLQNLLSAGVLSTDQRWGVAVASAIAARNPELRAAVFSDARALVDRSVIDDACAAAALMSMNNVYYRFLHMVGKHGYAQRPARLRMTRLAQPATNKLDFELFSIAVSAINGCESCIRGHEHVVTEHGLSEDHVHEAVRLAATIHAAAVALEIAEDVSSLEELPGVTRSTA